MAGSGRDDPRQEVSFYLVDATNTNALNVATAAVNPDNNNTATRVELSI